MNFAGLSLADEQVRATRVRLLQTPWKNPVLNHMEVPMNVELEPQWMVIKVFLAY